MTNCVARCVCRSLLGVLWFLGAWVTPAPAQERPQVLAEISGGWVGFPDDGLVNETLVGGTLGWFATPRLSVGPEVSVIQGTHHRHVLAGGNATFHFANFGAAHIVPYVLVAGGLFQTRFDHLDGSVTTRDGMLSAGAGVRGALSRRVILGVEARAGWETHIRVTGSLGVTLGRR